MNQYLVRGLLGILTLMVVVNFLIFPPNGEPGGYSYSVLKSSRTDLSTNVLLNKTDEVYLSSSLDEKLSGGKLKVISIIGTRPETIKMFPIIKMLQEHPDISSIVLASGQHQKMVEPLLKTFGIHVDINLNVMVAQQGLTAMTERLVNRIGKAIEHTKPDWILVQGDTSTAFIAGLISFYHKIPVGHVEAGLRTYHRYSPFPEEINRRLLGSLSSIHFSPTTVSSQHLAMEGIPASRIHVTGNTVIDALKWMAEQPPSNAASALMDAVYTGIADRSKVRIVLVTAHRRENLGEPLTHICNAILKLVQTVPDIHVVFPIHLNPAVQQVVRSILSDNPRIILWDPLDYDVFAYLMKYVHLVMTDSGGIQEEATAFSVPILVLRDTTERPEGVSAGMAKLIGTDQETIFNEGSKMLTDDAYYQTMVRANSPYGDGTAAKIIVDLLLSKTGKFSVTQVNCRAMMRLWLRLKKKQKSRSPFLRQNQNGQKSEPSMSC